MMLAAARRQYVEQLRIAASAMRAAAAVSAPVGVARTLQRHQYAAITLALDTAPEALAEQGIDAAQDAAVNVGPLLTSPDGLRPLLEKAESSDALARLVGTLTVDASRTAAVVDAATRPAVTGYVRSLQPPSCSRCAILAGRVYPTDTGFARHPRCDCIMTPTTLAAGRDLVTDPMVAFERGQVRGLSKADTEAIRVGADIDQVVEVRRKRAGLAVGSSVIARAGRMTPEGIMRLAEGRADAVRLLRRFGYLV
jgi:hypothetical protein